MVAPSTGTLKVPTLYDPEDYLKNLSLTNLKNSPKPKAGTSNITPQKFVSMNVLVDLKKRAGTDYEYKNGYYCPTIT
jgi:hypothetical protein